MRGVLSAVEFDPRSWWTRPAAIPTMAGLDLASRVTTPERYAWTKPVESCSPSELIPPPRRAALPRGGLRFRHQAQHPAPPGAGGLPRDRGARPDLRRGRAGAQARRHLPLQRPRRSRAAAARRWPTSASCSAASPSSASASATSCSASRVGGQHLQAEVRPPRRQPPGASTSSPTGSRSPRTITASPWTRIRSTSTRSRSPT